MDPARSKTLSHSTERAESSVRVVSRTAAVTTDWLSHVYKIIINPEGNVSPVHRSLGSRDLTKCWLMIGRAAGLEFAARHDRNTPGV